jgi:hypothetical protein
MFKLSTSVKLQTAFYSSREKINGLFTSPSNILPLKKSPAFPFEKGGKRDDFNKVYI